MDDEQLLPDLTPEEYAEGERQWFYGLMLTLQARAEALLAHADIHRAVSKTIVESVIGGKRFIAQIWDARTQGTHGKPCIVLVHSRYEQAHAEPPRDLSGKLPTVLTAEELCHANAAAEEFSAWLEQHKPVSVRQAVQAFQDIGRCHQSQDSRFDFVFTLDDARTVLKFLQDAHTR